MSDQPSTPPGAERRQSERLSVSLSGKLLFDGGETPCEVHDISPEGALLTACEGVEVNHAVRLKVTTNGEFLGVVVWRRDDRMGLKFMQFEEDGMRLPAERRDEAPLRKVS